MTIGTKVEYHGKEYTVSGYVTVGEKLIALWLGDEDEAIKGNELRKVKTR